ncbi:MAG: hypothetical protein ABFE07_10325 [Armatimonadia bacterium]
MRHESPAVTTAASAFLGALLGFAAWIVIWFIAVHQFMQYVHAQEEMAGAAGIGPSPTALLLLMGTGFAAGAFFGWRLSVRRRQDEAST